MREVTFVEAEINYEKWKGEALINWMLFKKHYVNKIRMYGSYIIPGIGNMNNFIYDHI